MLTVNLDMETSENAFICKGCPYQYPIKKLVGAASSTCIIQHSTSCPALQYLEKETFDQKTVDVRSSLVEECARLCS